MDNTLALGMGGHQSASAQNVVWLTPPDLLAKLGHFDLDPCAAESQPWPTAKHHRTIQDDGLSEAWFGVVWCNPPYGSETGQWLRRMSNHNNGMALIFARTETQDWHRWVWPWASGILFLRGRLHFHRPDGQRAELNAGAPSALIAYGNECRIRLSALHGQLGHFVDLCTA